MNKIHIDFTTIREDFNEYEAENGQILRVKLVLVDIVTDSTDKSKFELNIKDISHVITRNEFDTSTMEFAKPDQVTKKDVVKELKFFPTKSVTNIYETKQSIIIIVLKVNSVNLTNKKDETNNPILRFTSEAKINIIVK